MVYIVWADGAEHVRYGAPLGIAGGILLVGAGISAARSRSQVGALATD